MHTRFGRPGFTLIELLVVIAIIAILAAILFPVFAQAREKARQSTCLSNQKQTALAFLLYAQDHDETLPSWPFREMIDTDPRFRGGWDYALWADAIQPYLKNLGVFACPSARDLASTRRGPAGKKVSIHIAYNEYIMNENYGWPRLAALSSAKNGVAEISLVAESIFAGIYQDWDDNVNRVADKAAPFQLYRLYCANGVDRQGEVCIGRHTDHGVNVTFADGHARFVPGALIQGGAGNALGEYPIVNPAARIFGRP